VTLRETLGGDARRIHELVEQLLDSEDSLIVLIDGHRAVSYGEGLNLSPCQLELVTIEMERAVRTAAGSATGRANTRRTTEGSNDVCDTARRARQRPVGPRHARSLVLREAARV
jgi:hypothetical protein